MRFVAFFRNLNQGQRNSPSTSMLVDAFSACGAKHVEAFQANGTVVFGAHEPTLVAEHVTAYLADRSPWSDVAFVRAAAWIEARIGDVTDYDELAFGRLEISLFDGDAVIPPSLPYEGKRCTILRGGSGYAITLNDRECESNGTPTLERLLATPVTSRGLPTIRRLLDVISKG